MKRCPSCGTQTPDNAGFCPRCGTSLQAVRPQYTPPREQKNKIAAALLAFFLGGLGIHYFYLGKPLAGVICIVTCGVGGILPLINFIALLTASDEHFEDTWLNPDNKFPVW